MKLRTEIEYQHQKYKLSLGHTGVALGSCFSEEVGHFLNRNKIDCLSNPFGVVYNLASIKNLFLPEPADIENHKFAIQDGIHLHYNYHSSLKAESKAEVERLIKNTRTTLLESTKKANFLVITLGTSWVYNHLATQTVVSNCHKQAAHLFNKTILDLPQQLAIFDSLYTYLRQLNPQLNIIFTVSPVRHIKDTLAANAYSKATLLVLCNQLIEKYPNCSYFPAYEIMLDDLRDYRFYKPDLIHPTDQAVSYILKHFTETFFEENLKTFLKEWQTIQSAMGHRPFNPSTEKHQFFIKETILRLKKLNRYVSVENEIAFMTAQLNQP
jgi:GSCFA family